MRMAKDEWMRSSISVHFISSCLSGTNKIHTFHLEVPIICCALRPVLVHNIPFVMLTFKPNISIFWFFNFSPHLFMPFSPPFRSLFCLLSPSIFLQLNLPIPYTVMYPTFPYFPLLFSNIPHHLPLIRASNMASKFG